MCLHGPGVGAQLQKGGALQKQSWPLVLYCASEGEEGTSEPLLNLLLGSLPNQLVVVTCLPLSDQIRQK